MADKDKASVDYWAQLADVARQLAIRYALHYAAPVSAFAAVLGTCTGDGQRLAFVLLVASGLMWNADDVSLRAFKEFVKINSV